MDTVTGQVDYNSPDYLQKLVGSYVESREAFVTYRLPGQETIHISIIKPDGIKRIGNPVMMDKSVGFVFHPFEESKSHPALFLVPSVSFTHKNVPPGLAPTHLVSQSHPVSAEQFRAVEHIRAAHQSGVNKILQQIDTGKLEKAVLSREKFVPGYSISQGPEIFFGLTQAYPNAFVYFLHLPGRMSWMGASPEILLAKKGTDFHTISLAGTTAGKDLEDIQWSEKEYHEQQLVSDFIEEKLSMFSIKDLKKSGPVTVQAGNLFHLRTDYEFNGQGKKISFGQLATLLHPTPAVCGLPMEIAKGIIAKVEKHSRAYYSGFLGPVDPNRESHLFVNLRCLQFVEGGLLIYAGGGITQGSEANKEWDETENKAKTLLSVIEKLSKFA